MRMYMILLTGLVVLAGCGKQDTTSNLQEPVASVEAAKSVPVVDVAEEESARLNEWLDTKFEEELDFSPMRRSFLGDKKDYDKVDDLSEQAQDFRLEWRRLLVEELKSKFDRAKLTPDAQTSYDLWIYEYELAAAADQFRRNDYAFTHLYGPHTAFAQFLVSVHKVDEPEDMDAYIERINELARALMQRLDSAKLSAEAGVRPPRFAYDGVLDQSRALIRGAPFENQVEGEGDSDLWADAQAKADALVAADKIDQATADRYKARAREALVGSWVPAYRTPIAWLEQDRQNADEIARGVSQLPNGEAYYAERLKNSTTTDMTPEEVHQIGLDNVVRIKREMEAIKEAVGFEGTLQEFFKFVREDDRFYYPNTDEGRQAYIDSATDQLF